jgi:hypothetical protein
LLPQDVGDVIGSEGTRRESLLQRSRHRFRIVLPDQLQEFVDLPG